jgi:hypothetical protein
VKRLLFADQAGFDWGLEVRQAAHVLHDVHQDDLNVVRDYFAERLGRSRFEFLRGSFFAAVAQTEEEIRRFQREAEALIEACDLALLASVHRRDGRKWLLVDEPTVTASDEAIEAELAAFLETERDDEAV